MRWISSVILSKPPSAVCKRDMPSFALRMATVPSRIPDSKRVDIDKPAASSAALLILRPEDSRLNTVSSSLSARLRFLCAVSEAILVFIICI